MLKENKEKGKQENCTTGRKNDNLMGCLVSNLNIRIRGNRYEGEGGRTAKKRRSRKEGLKGKGKGQKTREKWEPGRLRPPSPTVLG